MNDLLNQIRSPKTIALADKVRRLERDGKKIIKFQTGDPDFKTHDIVSEALRKSISKDETHYINSQGLPELRDAIAMSVNNDYGTPVDPAQVLVTAGGAQAVFIALLLLLNRGDEVILLEPYYPQYEYIVRLLGGIPKTVPASTKTSGAWAVDLESFEAAIGKNTKAVVLNSPNNPSGKILSSDEIGKIIEITEKDRIYIISDEVYSRIVDSGKRHVSLMGYPKIFDRLIYINSFSKSFAMSGWRLGYLISNREMAGKALKVLQLNTTCVPAFVQRAGVAALESKEVCAYTEFMAARYNDRRRAVYGLIKDHPVLGPYPDGAFYCLLRLAGFSPDDVDIWADRLLEKESVAVVPAHVYGGSVGSFFRISFSVDDDSLAEGVRRIMRFYDRNADERP